MGRTYNAHAYDFDLFERGSLEDVVQFISLKTGIKRSEIFGKERKFKRIVAARRYVFYAMYYGLNYTYRDIAMTFNMEHTNIQYNLKEFMADNTAQAQNMREQIMAHIDPALADEHRIVKFLLKSGIETKGSMPHLSQILTSVDKLLKDKGLKLAITKLEKK